MIKRRLRLVSVLLAFLLMGCWTWPVKNQPTPQPSPKPELTARSSPSPTPESVARKDLLKRVAELSEPQATSVLAGAGIPTETGISAKFTLAKTVNKADLPTLKNIAAHMP